MDENKEKKEVVEVTPVVETHAEKTYVEKPKEVQKNKNGFCIASMVLGIIALVLCCVFYISIPCAIVAIVFGVIGLKAEKKGMAIAGVITGSIGIVLAIAFVIFMFVFSFGMLGEYRDYLYNNDYDYDYYDRYDYDYDDDFDYYRNTYRNNNRNNSGFNDLTNVL